MKIPPKIDAALVASIDIDTELERKAIQSALGLVAGAGGSLPTSVQELAAFIPGDIDSISEGAPFRIPVLLPEGIETGDSREFTEGAVDSRTFPIPLYWQIFTASGHDGSVIVGRIDYAERLEEIVADEAEEAEMAEILGDDVAPVTEETSASTFKGWGNAVGVFDTGVFGREAERLVRNRMLRGVSPDLDKFEAAVENVEHDPEDIASYDIIKNDKITVSSARLMAATLVGKPAFQECEIFIDEPVIEVVDIPVEDGMYEEDVYDPEATLAAVAASAAPLIPPRSWFQNPGLKEATPINVTDDGRVFGHIASWKTQHIGPYRNQKPPRSRTDYAYFRTGVVRTDDGTDVTVGQLTLAGGHADISASAELAVKHYDDTASAMADVNVGEDQYGIWVAGALRPDATPEQVRALRASAPSGDWRPINGNLELVAVCQVNVPGFPLARAMVAGGQMTALVAAGARHLAELRQAPTAVEERLAALETIEFERRRAEALDRVRPFVEGKKAELSAKADDARARVAQIKNARQAREASELSAQAEAARARVLGARTND